MVRLRLKRFGRTHAPTYRLCAMDKRSPRNGRAIEELGYHHPCNPNEDEQTKLNEERIKYWLSVGAQPSETVANLLKKQGIDPTPGKKD
jgi:small subunit ribosomal protein S16